MLLPDEAKNYAKLKVEEVWKDRKCTVCGQEEAFHMTDRIFELRSHKSFGESLENENKDVAVIPIMIVACNGCGHMMFFNSTLLGVTKFELPGSENVIEAKESVATDVVAE